MQYLFATRDIHITDSSTNLLHLITPTDASFASANHLPYLTGEFIVKLAAGPIT